MSTLVTVRMTIENFEAPPEEWRLIGDRIFGATAALAEQVALSDATAEVELLEGSMKVKAGVIGSLLFAYSFIADYKGFKEGLSEMVSDGRAIAAGIRETIPKIVGETHPIPAKDVKKGRVVVVAEQVSELIEELEALKANSATMSERELHAALDKVASRFRSLQKQLDQKDFHAVEQYLIQGDLLVPAKRPSSYTPDQGKDAIRPDLPEELRRRIEGRTQLIGGAIQKETEDNRQMAVPRRRRRRRMYFKRAPVLVAEENPKLL